MSRAGLSRAFGVSLAIGLTWLVSCGQDPLPAEPAGDEIRLAVMSPALSATLVEMGMGDLIVARHAYDMSLAREVVSAGDEAGIDAEALVRARPSHVLFDESSTGSIEQIQELAERGGWDLAIYDVRTLDAILASAKRLRDEFAPGDGPASEAIARFERQVARRESLFRGRVLLLAQTRPPGAIGPASFHGEILNRLGVHNAISQATAWRNLDAEDVLSLAPDAIVLFRWSTPNAPTTPPPTIDELRSLLGVIGELNIPAVREGHLAMIDDPLALTPSLALGRLALQLEEILDSFAN